MCRMPLDEKRIVKRGTCYYDNTAEYEVVIAESDILYGSGDGEDPDDVAEDKDTKCYYVWYDTPASRGIFNAGGGGYLTVEGAVESVESRWPVAWKVL